MSERTYCFNKPISETELIRTAKNAIAERLTDTPLFDSPQAVKDFLTLEFAHQQVEVFYTLFLNTKHQLLKREILFQGTIDSASVYPREVVRKVIEYNAVAVIFAHNHPSGNAEPSQADRAITKRLQQALALIDVRVLDHLIVGSDTVLSFAERGML